MTEKNKKINLTDDPLINIYMMIPLLSDKAREAVSYLMYGCYLGEELSEDKKKKQTHIRK